jgi:sec-independent protein translocase protein TatA
MVIGVWELLLLLLVVLGIFGAGKLPHVMGDLARGVRSFKAGLKDEQETGPAEHATVSASSGRQRDADVLAR